MPTDQPNSAASDTTPQPNDEETAARVLHDESLDTPPGGGGLGGASAADALGGSARAPSGASPNAPIDIGVAGSDDAAAESRVEASRSTPAEPHPSSQ